jgi:hypothetical protein
MTGLAMGLPQALDGGLAASLAMDSDKNWQVTIETEDALLFSLAPNGTVIMRALSHGEWEERQAENQGLDRSRPMADVVRSIVSAGSAARPASSEAIHL